MSLRTHEPIPGYTLEERIGVGGYGEVWSAQAPGGLSKAVKLVYGHFDDERAARELKALNRIKEVRHPFLLSLERFEIIDGQLIIVSELADGSLKDRFEQANADGPGTIPREELLGYMRDAADALDYMNDQFSLQHLDVKPENLLLVGGRVKVADFGLVKELHDVTASMMGGLTPVYASPEVFDGRPSQRSDQYSLAIVFQEMLTGVLPFPGKTAAQLASQHVHSRPRLTPLPLADQPIIARALSKDPAQRFASCRALVDALSGAITPATRQSQSSDSRQKSASEPINDTTPIRSRAVDTDHDWRCAKGTNGHAAPPSPNIKTLVISEAPEAVADEVQDAVPMTVGRGQELRLPPSAPTETPIDLGPLELAASASGLRPTLFLGIGGTATRVLRKLRRQIHDRFGATAEMPALQMLLLDTDAQSLHAATQGDRESSLADCEILALPLRSARDYAAQSAGKLAWLSRRWLYNIPRSLQTEGRRPLGRLALVDHADRAFERIREALVAITGAEAREATTRSTGQQFESNVPRVFVVSSISGGTGSGMVLDVAYAVRTILADLGMADDGVCGLMIHSTDRNPSAADLATANAYAALAELHHYSESGCFPGDAAAGLPPYAAGEGTFPHGYLVHLGDRLDDEQFDQAAGTLASYLYLNSVTPAAVAFDACRDQTPASADRASLRSFGLLRLGSQFTALPTLAVEQLCRDLIDHWRGEARAARGPAAPTSLAEMATQREMPSRSRSESTQEQPAVAHAKQLGLELQELGQHVRALVDAQLGGSSEQVLAELRSQVGSKPAAQPSQYVEQMLAAISNVFGPAVAPDPPAKPTPAPIQVALEQWLKQFAEPVGAAVHDWIVSLIECPGARIASAARAKQWYDSHLRGIEAEVIEQIREQKRTLPLLEQALRTAAGLGSQGKRSFFGGRGNESVAHVEPMLAQLVELRCQQAAAQSLARVLRLILAPIASCGDQIADLQRELGQLITTFDQASPWDLGVDATTPLCVVNQVRMSVADRLRGRMPELVAVVDARLQENYFAGEGGLRVVLGHAAVNRATLEANMRSEARAQILETLRQMSFDEAALAAEGDEAREQSLRACLEATRPQLNRCGGSQRLVAISPKPIAESALADAFNRVVDPAATVLCDTDADFVLCYEAQELWVPHVAARLIGDRGDLAHIASRLHTRSDIHWSEWPAVETPIGSEAPLAVKPPWPTPEAADQGPSDSADVAVALTTSAERSTSVSV